MGLAVDVAAITRLQTAELRARLALRHQRLHEVDVLDRDEVDLAAIAVTFEERLAILALGLVVVAA